MGESVTRGLRIERNTAVTTTLSMLGSVVVFAVSGTLYYQRVIVDAHNEFDRRITSVHEIAMGNQSSIDRLTTTVTIGDLKNQLISLQSEQRTLDRLLNADPENTLLKSQKQRVDQEIQEVQDAIKCHRERREFCE